ncbi:MAG: hypothetical protein ABW321_31095 [Polyangiales bacterium]
MSPRTRLWLVSFAVAATTGVPAHASPEVSQTAPVMVNGIVVDDQGHLWVCDGLGSELLELEAPGERILARYGRDVGVDGPDDLVIDHDFVYYTANFTLFNAVAKLDRRTGRAATIAEPALGTNPIAWTPEGKLYVGATPAASGELGAALGITGLYEVDPISGAYALVVADDGGSNGFSVGPDGAVYGPHWTGTSVIRIDPQSGEVRELHKGLQFASSVRYNVRDDRLYVLTGETAYRATLVSMALDGSNSHVFARLSEQPDALLVSADNFAIAPDGTFYVTRFVTPIITRVSADGATIDDFHVGRR